MRYLPKAHSPRRFQNTNPERGRKQRGACLVACHRRISEHEPRKGTETTPFESRLPMRLPISEHEPRKGTETRFHPSSLRSIPTHFRTRTPKGDGNFLLLVVAFFIVKHFRTRTPKGDGNFFASGFSAFGLEEFQNTNPERGRKHLSAASIDVPPVDFRTRTPKGDGNFSSLLPNPYLVYIFQNVNPERGRKHLVNLAVQADLLEHFRM